MLLLCTAVRGIAVLFRVLHLQECGHQHQQRRFCARRKVIAKPLRGIVITCTCVGSSSVADQVTFECPLHGNLRPVMQLCTAVGSIVDNAKLRSL